MTDDLIEMEMKELEKHQDYVWKRFPQHYFPMPVIEPMNVTATGEEVPNRFAIVDDFKDPGDEGRIFNICSDQYGLRLHETVIYKIMEVCTELVPTLGDPKYSLVLTLGGARMKFEVTFPSIQHEIKSGDIVYPRLYTLNSYDLGWKLTHRSGVFREICSNGAVIGEIWSTFRKRHVAGLDIGLLIDDIKASADKFQLDTIEWKRWTERKVPAEDYEKLWQAFVDGKVFNKTEKDKVEILPERATNKSITEFLRADDLTLWDLHNVVSQFITHEITSEVRRVEVEPTAGSIFERYAKAA